MSKNGSIVCGQIRHMGLLIPCDAAMVWQEQQMSLLQLQQQFYESLGYFVDHGQEAQDADRAGNVMRFRVRDANHQIVVSFSENPMTSLELVEMLGWMHGLHICLSASPEHLEALLAHPNFERGPVIWGRGSKSVFLKDPVGYEVEIQLINCPD